MTPNVGTLSSHDDLNKYPEYPLQADLRKMISQLPLPIVAPETLDSGSMNSEELIKQALAVLKKLNDSLAANDAETLQSCFFAKQAYWKDQLALTYHLRTFTTPGVIVASLLETKTLRGITELFEIVGKPQFVVLPLLQFIDCEFAFRTELPAATCSGRMILLPVKSKEQGNDDDTVTWKIWILSTKLENFDLHPEDEALLRSPGRRIDNIKEFETDVFIVGGGNAAVALAARLKAMGVDSIMAERNAHVGDNWALRYDSMRFHIPTSSCELPYIYYQKELQSPHLLTKDELAEHLQRYVAAFNLNVITSVEIVQTTLMQDQRWCIKFHTPAGTCTAVTKHIVQATGIGSQKPYLPPMADEQLYKGINMHSAQYKNANDLQNKLQNQDATILIIGSANTAFDVLEDCHNAQFQTTMVVRSPTYIVPIDYISNKLSLGAYDASVEAADRLFLTLPTVVDSQFARNLFAHLSLQEPNRFSALATAGFPVLDSRDPDALLAHNIFERAGGHYVDVGGTALLAEGKASVKAGVEPVAYTAKGLRFSDGTSINADAIIWCTGFADKNALDTASETFKTKFKLHVDATWGIDKEGEIRGMWKRHLHLENYWVIGGHTQQHRWYSRTLALQIKAALEGVLPPAYRDNF